MWETRIRFGKDRRKWFVIEHCRTERAALARAIEMVEIAEGLVSAGKESDVETIVAAAGKAENTAKLVKVRNFARSVCDGTFKHGVAPTPQLPESTTFQEFGVLWTDGVLAQKWPDHIETKRSALDDAWRLKKHVYPILGPVAIREITLEDADRVMASLPRALSKASRRHVAQLIVRIMNMATYPARLRSVSPIPRKWLPKLKRKVQYPILFSHEDATLLRTTKIPLYRRLLYGILHREGLRRGDLAGLRWRQLDLDFGTLRIEIDKTDHARLIPLSPGVVAALRAWKEMRAFAAQNDFVFAGEKGTVPNLDHLAAQLRDDLKEVGVSRQELFEAHGGWGRFNVHTLRHSYVTRSLALGVTEDKVRQHTGHKSDELQRYRECADSLAGLNLEDVLPLDEAIPEFAKVGTKVGTNVGKVEKRALEISSGAAQNRKLLN